MVLFFTPLSPSIYELLSFVYLGRVQGWYIRLTRCKSPEIDKKPKRNLKDTQKWPSSGSKTSVPLPIPLLNSNEVCKMEYIKYYITK